jgi:bifunctional non-homologous end joining protein LigD
VLPLVERKRRLEVLLRGSCARVVYVPHVEGAEGQKLYEAAIVARREGIVSKRAGSPYVGGNTRDWLRIKAI